MFIKPGGFNYSHQFPRAENSKAPFTSPVHHIINTGLLVFIFPLLICPRIRVTFISSRSLRHSKHLPPLSLSLPPLSPPVFSCPHPINGRLFVWVKILAWCLDPVKSVPVRHVLHFVMIYVALLYSLLGVGWGDVIQKKKNKTTLTQSHSRSRFESRQRRHKSSEPLSICSISSVFVSFFLIDFSVVNIMSTFPEGSS